jgi:hypothetical protein
VSDVHEVLIRRGVQTPTVAPWFRRNGKA